MRATKDVGVDRRGDDQVSSTCADKMGNWPWTPVCDAVTEAAESANSRSAGWSEKDKRKVHVGCTDGRRFRCLDVSGSQPVELKFWRTEAGLPR